MAAPPPLVANEPRQLRRLSVQFSVSYMNNDRLPANQSFLISDWCHGILLMMSDSTKRATKGVISLLLDAK